MQILCSPEIPLIKVYCSGNISDQSQNGLDGNRDGVSEGSPKDDFTLSFTTGTDRDTVAPVFTDIKVNKNELWPGFDIKITGRVTDSSNVSISQIVSAECFIDSITSAGTGQPFIPKDGLFNSPDEEVSITVKTRNWSAGVHNLYLFAKDFEGNTGVMLVTINILSHDKLAANWPMYGQNPQHTFFNANDSIKLPLTIKWSKKLFNNPVNQVAVADNMVFVTENNSQTSSKVICLNAETGDSIWVYDIWGNCYVKTPAYYKGRVYIPIIGTPDYGSIYVLDVVNGELLWEITWSYGVGQNLTISDDKIFFKYEFGNFYAISALERKFLWYSNIYSSKLDWVPSFKDGIVYTCGENSSYSAFDADSGKVISSLGTPMIGITPVVKDNIIYTSSPVSAINLNNNKVLWSKPGTMPSAAYGKIFLVNGDSLQVLDELNGNVLWKFKSSAVIKRPPVISNNYVFLSTTSRALGIDINTHNEVWTYPETGEFVVADNHLFLSTSDGHLICFDEAPVSVKDEERALPLEFDLMQNFPNPFNPSTTIEYVLPKKSHVKIEIYNQLGELVRILVNSEKSAGYHTISWNAVNVSSGVYFCRIITEGYSKTRKMMLLK